MAQAGWIKLGAGNNAANNAAILTRRRFVSVVLEVEGICKCVQTGLMGCKAALYECVTFVSIFEAKCNIQVTGKVNIDRHHEVGVAGPSEAFSVLKILYLIGFSPQRPLKSYDIPLLNSPRMPPVMYTCHSAGEFRRLLLCP